MSLESVTTSLSPRQKNTPSGKIIRQSANYHPSAWGDYFNKQISEDDTKILAAWRDEAKILKEEVRKMFSQDFGASETLEKLALIDATQRLGIAYHFTGEIEQASEQIFTNIEKYYNDHDLDLSTTSLLFRIRRQQGYPIPCDIFEKFRYKEGTFKEDLVGGEDIAGMLDLYEAAHLRVHGEGILDDAVDFTKSHLESMAGHINDHNLANQVLHALDQPIRLGLPRLEARRYISYYRETQNHNQILLKFAELDFNILQKLHQEELSIIVKWWKELDVKRKLPFTRDRIVECYFWALGVYFEPQYSLGRKFFTRVIAVTSIIDDIYDVYGTKQEVELFTEAVNRWEISAMDKLPEYMRSCYRALLDVYRDMEEEMANKGASFHFVYYVKEGMKTLAQAYFAETEWLNTDKVPTFEEYMKVALVTSGYSMLTATSFVGMEQGIVTKEAFDWLRSEPEIVRAASTVGRIMDDMVSQLEREREHIPSAVECYMKQYGVSEQEAHRVLSRLVDNAWKDINQAFLIQTASQNAPLPLPPMPLLTRILNLARMIHVIYKHGDGYSNSQGRTEQFITSLLVKPIEIV